MKTALKELQQLGYLRIEKITPDKTKSGRIEYVYDIFEKKQEGGKQGLEKLPLEILDVENQPLLNTKEVNTKEVSTKEQNTNYKDSPINPPEGEGLEEQAMESMFDRFWNSYPNCKRKVDKKASYKAFKRIKDLDKEFPSILEGLEACKSDWEKDGFEYTPLVTRWIHGEYWKAALNSKRESLFDAVTDDDMDKFMGGNGKC